MFSFPTLDLQVSQTAFDIGEGNCQCKGFRKNRSHVCGSCNTNVMNQAVFACIANGLTELSFSFARNRLSVHLCHAIPMGGDFLSSRMQAANCSDVQCALFGMSFLRSGE